MSIAHNVDPAEIEKFEQLAHDWWDKNSHLKTLHDINPLRLAFIQQRCSLAGQRVLDIGCGGGILSESLAAQSAQVTGIDLAKASIGVAQLHQQTSGHDIEYLTVAAETFAEERPQQYDVVVCMELLEHVPDPAAIVTAAATLLKPGGHLFLSTLNRTPKAYTQAILGAEYLLRLLPRGTHDYEKFIRPAELAEWLRAADMDLKDLKGMGYHPLKRHYFLREDVSVNYLLHAQKSEDRA